MSSILSPGSQALSLHISANSQLHTGLLSLAISSRETPARVRQFPRDNAVIPSGIGCDQGGWRGQRENKYAPTVNLIGKNATICFDKLKKVLSSLTREHQRGLRYQTVCTHYCEINYTSCASQCSLHIFLVIIGGKYELLYLLCHGRLAFCLGLALLSILKNNNNTFCDPGPRPLNQKRNTKRQNKSYKKASQVNVV